MSRYHLNRFLFDLKMKPDTLDRARVDLDKALSDYDLTAEEVAAIKARDPRPVAAAGRSRDAVALPDAARPGVRRQHLLDAEVTVRRRAASG